MLFAPPIRCIVSKMVLFVNWLSRCIFSLFSNIKLNVARILFVKYLIYSTITGFVSYGNSKCEPLEKFIIMLVFLTSYLHNFDIGTCAHCFRRVLSVHLKNWTMCQVMMPF
jgi:hypothetical protein